MMRNHRHPRRTKLDPATAASVMLYGLHPVRAALANPGRRVHRLFVTPNAAAKLLTEQLARLDACEASVRDLDRMVGPDAVHQGVVAEAEPLANANLSDVATSDLVVVLDQITDPHNVGAVLRSAAALNAGALITTQRNSPPETGVLAKSASGALDVVPIVRVGNLSNALKELSRMGYATVGLDSEGEADLIEAMPQGPLALVLGAEGRGLRRLTRETVDVLSRVDMPGRIKSLNVSNAAAISLYVARRHLDAQ